MQLRTSDYAACANIKQSNVRYFDAIGLLSPAGRNPQSKYRSYDLRQVPHMYLLKTLTEMGFSLRQLSEFGQARTPEKALELYRACEEQLAEKFAGLQAQREMLRSHAALIEEGLTARPDEIGPRTLPAQPMRCAPLGQDRTARGSSIRGAFERVRENSSACCPLGFGYDDFFELLERPDQPSRLVSYDPRGPETRPAGEYLVGTAACGYGETGGLPRRMFDYALDHGLEFTGPAYMIHLIDTASAADPDRYLLQISAAVAHTVAAE